MDLKISNRVSKRIAILTLAFAVNAVAGSTAAAQNPATPAYTLKTYAQGYSHPIRLVSSPLEGSPLMVVEQEGKVSALNADPKSRKPYFDFSAELDGGSGEGGLLDFVFSPNFSESPTVVASYTGKSRTREFRVSEFTASKSDADPGSERKLIRLMIKDFVNLGGALAFGDDGRLYIGLGDGSGPSDPEDRGQNRTDLFGSVLRIGPAKGSTPKQEYETLADNPFGKNGLGNPDVWAYGFRNPRSLTFDSARRTLWEGDTGVGLEQEINEVKSGANYGWAVYDGKQCLRMRFECLDKGYAPPAVSYGKESGAGIIIGPVYTAAKHPALQGMLLYSDTKSGKIWGLKRDNGTTTANPLLVSSGRSIDAIGVDGSGRIFAADYDKGEILELIAPEADQTAGTIAK